MNIPLSLITVLYFFSAGVAVYKGSYVLAGIYVCYAIANALLFYIDMEGL